MSVMSLKQIEHVVVLMLENRSFDSLLGWLYERDAPALNIPAAAHNDRFRGMQSVNPANYVNTALGGTLRAEPTRGVQGFSVPGVDPGEEFGHVNTQFFRNANPSPDDPVTMTGLLQDFTDILKARGYGTEDIIRRAKTVMESYTPSQLPVLNQLAKHYAVSDAWFASVPSQTNPNRAFLLCGTSNGLVNNGELEPADSPARSLEAVLGVGIGDDRFEHTTIFNALSKAGVDWSVFWQTSFLPQKISRLLDEAPALILALTASGHPELAAFVTILLEALAPDIDYLKQMTSGNLDSCYTWRLFPQIGKNIPNADRHFQNVDAFHQLARSGRLPKFSYIEPFWSISPTGVDDGKKKLVTALGNDYHPPCNILVGEQFLSDVYSSLIANRDAWCKTLLLVTFDEFVGVFDHEKPPGTTPPWGKHGQPPFHSPTNFRFDRLGARVPTILVSPYVQKETVFRSTGDVPYDHTSVIATTLKWLGRSDGIAGFGERTAAAPTFEGVLTLDEPRTDERALAFIDTARAIGELVRYGDALVLKNQEGQYLSTFSRAWKVDVGSAMPSELLDIGLDLDLAACFPTVGNGRTAELVFLTHSPDPPVQINENDRVLIVSREAGLGAFNFLGSWADSSDCYYYDEYLDGENVTRERWVVEKLTQKDQPLRFGERIFLTSEFDAGQRLSRDMRPIVGAPWITTALGGDWWTVEPANMRAT
jgi:phospholipase C